MTIPDDWEGDKEIEIFITAVYAVGLGQLSESGEMSAQAEDVSIEFIPNQRVRGFISARDSSRVSGYEGEFGPADITVLDSSEAPVDEGAGQRSATKGSPSASGKSGVPNTGDVIPLATIAAAGVVAAGAARRALKSKDE